MVDQSASSSFVITLPTGYWMRPARYEDLGEVVHVLNLAYQDLLGTDRFSEGEINSDWGMPGFDLEQDSRIVVAPDGQIAGYLDLFDLNPLHVRINCYGQVHPGHRGQGIAYALLSWAEQRAGLSISKAPENARVSLITYALSINRNADRVIKSRGFQLIRYSLQMVTELTDNIPLPIWPEGINLRRFVPGQDDIALVQAEREAFSDHWGHVESPFEFELARHRHFWKTDPDFDPELYFLALDGDQIAGMSLCFKRIEEDSGYGLGWLA